MHTDRAEAAAAGVRRKSLDGRCPQHNSSDTPLPGQPDLTSQKRHRPGWVLFRVLSARSLLGGVRPRVSATRRGGGGRGTPLSRPARTRWAVRAWRKAYGKRGVGAVMVISTSARIRPSTVERRVSVAEGHVGLLVGHGEYSVRGDGEDIGGVGDREAEWAPGHPVGDQEAAERPLGWWRRLHLDDQRVQFVVVGEVREHRDRRRRVVAGVHLILEGSCTRHAFPPLLTPHRPSAPAERQSATRAADDARAGRPQATGRVGVPVSGPRAG